MRMHTDYMAKKVRKYIERECEKEGIELN